MNLAGAAALLVLALAGFRAVPLASALPPAEPAANPPPEVLVQWMIRTSDMIACQAVTPELRRISHRYGGRVRIVIYPIGSDTTLVRSYLRRERLDRVVLQRITEREFRRDFTDKLPAHASTPAMIVSHRGTEAQAFEVSANTTPGQRGVVDFSTHIAAILQPGGLAANHRRPSIRSGDE
jgi:hypothetical protein